MCGRFTLTVPAHEIEEAFGLFEGLDPATPPRYNIAPTQQVLALRTDEAGKRYVSLRWGLVPFWADDLKIGSRLLNPKGMPWYRVFGNWGLNVFTFVIFGMWTTDSQSGLRGFSRAALDKIEIRMDRMEVSSEFIKEIRRCRLPFREVPIRAIYEPGNTYSNSKGYVNYAGVDNAAEMITMMSAMRSYEANVAAMNMTKTLAMKALAIGGNGS